MEIDDVLRKLGKYNKSETRFFSELFSLKLYGEVKEISRDKESAVVRTNNDEFLFVKYIDNLLEKFQFNGITFKVFIEYDSGLHGYLITAELNTDRFMILVETDGRIIIDITKIISDSESINSFWKQFVYDLFYKKGVSIRKIDL